MNDYTSTFDYLDDKMSEFGSFHSWLEDQIMNDPPMAGQLAEKIEKAEKREARDRARTMTRREKFKFRPCVGCPDCRHWDYRRCECTNPNPNPEICDWISERYMEKGE